MRRIKLLKELTYVEAGPLESTRPQTGFPTGGPPREVATYDNSVHYPQGTELEVELDGDRQALESSEGVTWFQNSDHPGGFPVPDTDFRYIDAGEEGPAVQAQVVGR